MSDRLERSASLRAAFGRVVHDERTRRGLPRSLVAERAGLRAEQVRAIESGHANCNIFAYDRLARHGLGQRFATLVPEAEQRADDDAAAGESDAAAGEPEALVAGL